MTKPIIEVTNISKKYRIGKIRKHDTLRDELAGFAEYTMGILKGQNEEKLEAGEFWALKDVSFNVNPGEVLGIIGKNGSGKSTLLKILSRITAPSSGEVHIRGRVASLLEVGTGFSPELTGRENIFLNGAILGMTRREIGRKFNEIVAFSEIEKFIDTPVKHYSSGMYVRLAFAVAAHLESEILILDEVLAVGDAQFQKKCMLKINEMSKNNLRTILFVSHNLQAVGSMCTKALLIDNGKISDYGFTSEVLSKYLASSASLSSLNYKFKPKLEIESKYKLTLLEATIRLKDSSPEKIIYLDTPVSIELRYENLNPDIILNITFHIIDQSGVIVFVSTSVPSKRAIGVITETCFIPSNLLNDNTYYISLYVVKDESEAIYFEENILNFDVKEKTRRIKWFGKWQGFVRPKLNWSTQVSK